MAAVPELSSRAAAEAGFSDAQLSTELRAAIDAVGRVLLGQREVIRLAVAALLARGHILFEDVPGVGKTTLARALARVLGASFSRIQFTADMLPSDVLGVQVLDPKEGMLRFRKGPLFAELVLADEINRASPKTQSAMLEAMAERRVTVDDVTYELPPVFVVVATQNPLEHHGAYPLPESQLDRFTVCLSLGYPSAAEERALVQQPRGPESVLGALPQLVAAPRLLAAALAADAVHLSDAVADYLLAVVRATREHPDVFVGASPRAAMAFACVARAWAFLDGRSFVIPDDVRAVAPHVLAHRLALALTGAAGIRASDAARAVVGDVLARVPVPR